MHDSSFERDREREEEGVEFGPVEAFAEVGAGGDDDEPGVVAWCRHGFMDGGESLLAESAFEDVWFMAVSGKLFADGVDVAGALGEDETGATGVDCCGDVGADLGGAIRVLGEGREDLLDRGGAVVVDEACWVDDQPSLDERRFGQVAGAGFVSGGAALQGDDAFEPVASIRGGGETEPTPCWCGADAGLE